MRGQSNDDTKQPNSSQQSAKPDITEYVTATVIMARPDPDVLSGQNRAQKYRALRESGSEARERLVAWIEATGLTEEVSRVSEPTAFNLLFVDATPAAIERLASGPGVEQVSVIPELFLDIPEPDAKRIDLDDANAPDAPGDSRKKTSS